MSRAVKAYWSQWDLLPVREGVLYRLWVSDSGEQNTYLLVVPQILRSDILYELHNGPTGGHLGQKKTRAKVRARCYWYSMRGDSSVAGSAEEEL